MCWPKAVSRGMTFWEICNEHESFMFRVIASGGEWNFRVEGDCPAFGGSCKTGRFEKAFGITSVRVSIYRSTSLIPFHQAVAWIDRDLKFFDLWLSRSFQVRTWKHLLQRKDSK